jgi:DNA-binding NarL/FixJ family response regulator
MPEKLAMDFLTQFLRPRASSIEPATPVALGALPAQDFMPTDLIPHDSLDGAPMKKPSSPAIITVAVVEDDPGIRSSLVKILARDKGLLCVGNFGSAEAALAELPKLQPAVVLMDVNLPGLDGVECVKRLAGRLKNTQIIMLTVHEATDVIFNSIAAGANGYLIKPPRAAELTAAIRDVTAGGAPMTSFIARKVIEAFKRAAPSPRETENLAPREIEVLELLVKGFAYKEVAAELKISYSTVHTYIERIYDKLHVQSRSHAVAKYLGA